MIEGDWQAWYDRLPGSADPPLHVAGTCEVDGTIAELRLEPDETAGEDGLVRLTLVAERPGSGGDTPVERQVSWTGEPGAGIRRVRIGGETDALIDVSDGS